MPGRKDVPVNEIVGLYRKGFSCNKIAVKYGVGPRLIWRRLKEMDEPTRKSEETRKTLENLGYFYKVTRYWKGKKQPREMVERRSQKIRGPNHYLWKGGKSRRQYRSKIRKEICNLCGGKLNLGIHHIDFDHYNNSPENLQVLCVSCHCSLHKQAYWDAIHAGKKPPKSNAPCGWNRKEKNIF